MRADLVPGNPFPDISLPEHTGRELSLAEISSAQPLVLCFVRGWWCPKEQVRLANIVGLQEELQREYGRIAVVTVDEPYVNGAFRAGLGADFPLMVDANMRWSVDEAIRAARALAPLEPVWLEEPTIPDDVPGHARIVREGGLPIAAGENLHTLHEFRALIEAGGVTFPEPDVTNCGGVTTFMKVCHLAEAFNLPVVSHLIPEFQCHLIAGIPNGLTVEYMPWTLRFYEETPRMEEGQIVVPDKPGFGLAFDEKALEKYAVA